MAMTVSDRRITAMSSRASTELYPIMVVEDRYQGVYSGGRWWAVARAR
ncbi:hypothetical protein [Sphingomonas ginsenosidimutans]|nr:hypothetical protein [Sphingomonas ginsenosidimutans]